MTWRESLVGKVGRSLLVLQDVDNQVMSGGCQELADGFRLRLRLIADNGQHPTNIYNCA